MPAFDPSRIANLVGQLGGDHRQAAQQLQSVSGPIDPVQHAQLLRNVSIDPQQLQNGGYQQHLDAQNQADVQGYQPGELAGQSPRFDRIQTGVAGADGQQHADEQDF